VILRIYVLSNKAKRKVPALVKETGWNDEVEGPEHRGVLSVGRAVCYTTQPVEKCLY
jgi:hypothetical protein